MFGLPCRCRELLSPFLWSTGSTSSVVSASAVAVVFAKYLGRLVRWALGRGRQARVMAAIRFHFAIEPATR